MFGAKTVDGPGCCSYLEHISSTDCAFSFLFDSLPVFCLLFRHRISFQPAAGFHVWNLLLTILFGRNCQDDLGLFAPLTFLILFLLRFFERNLLYLLARQFLKTQVTIY